MTNSQGAAGEQGLAGAEAAAASGAAGARADGGAPGVGAAGDAGGGVSTTTGGASEAPAAGAGGAAGTGGAAVLGGAAGTGGAVGAGGAPPEPPHITSSENVGVLTEAQFTALCDERGGSVEVMPHCGGFATAKGFSYDNATLLLSEHTCAGANTCGGWNCVIIEE